MTEEFCRTGKVAGGAFGLAIDVFSMVRGERRGMGRILIGRFLLTQLAYEA
jgi:hypothetical protein